MCGICLEPGRQGKDCGGGAAAFLSFSHCLQVSGADLVNVSESLSYRVTRDFVSPVSLKPQLPQMRSVVSSQCPGLTTASKIRCCCAEIPPCLLGRVASLHHLKGEEML